MNILVIAVGDRATWYAVGSEVKKEINGGWKTPLQGNYYNYSYQWITMKIDQDY